MTTQYTSILKLALPVQGELSGTWGDVVNDNITSMVEEAVAVCDTEPETQFFLATLLAAKGNMTGSIHHYRTTLRLDPDYPGGVDQLRIPSCYVKYHLNDGPGDAGGGHCHAPGQGGGGKECGSHGGGLMHQVIRFSEFAGIMVMA